MLFVTLLLLASTATAWDPDAGLVISHTRNKTVTVTSSNETAANIVDGRTDTFWQSGACLPTGYIPRTGLNSLLGACAAGKCDSTGPSDDLYLATDGTFYGGPVVDVIDNQALFTVMFDAGRNSIRRVHLRAKFNNNTNLWIATDQENTTLAVLTPDDSYNDIIIIDNYDNITYIGLSSNSDFQVFEIATLSDRPCFEMAIVDIGMQEVGVISTRHWAGSLCYLWQFKLLHVSLRG